MKKIYLFLLIITSLLCVSINPAYAAKNLENDYELNLEYTPKFAYYIKTSVTGSNADFINQTYIEVAADTSLNESYFNVDTVTFNEDAKKDDQLIIEIEIFNNTEDDLTITRKSIEIETREQYSLNSEADSNSTFTLQKGETVILSYVITLKRNFSSHSTLYVDELTINLKI